MTYSEAKERLEAALRDEETQDLALVVAYWKGEAEGYARGYSEGLRDRERRPNLANVLRCLPAEPERAATPAE